MLQCQAKSKRSQKQCKNYAVRGKKTCRMHGGIIGGKKAQKARKKAVTKHGFFSQEAIQERKQLSQLIKENKEIIQSI